MLIMRKLFDSCVGQVRLIILKAVVKITNALKSYRQPSLFFKIILLNKRVFIIKLEIDAKWR